MPISQHSLKYHLLILCLKSFPPRNAPIPPKIRVCNNNAFSEIRLLCRIALLLSSPSAHKTRRFHTNKTLSNTSFSVMSLEIANNSCCHFSSRSLTTQITCQDALVQGLINSIFNQFSPFSFIETFTQHHSY